MASTDDPHSEIPENGARGATPTAEHVAERVKLDLWYINNWSLWLDIQILMKTFFEVLRKRNAY